MPLSLHSLPGAPARLTLHCVPVATRGRLSALPPGVCSLHPHRPSRHSLPQRTGRREELLRGPLYYAIAHVAVTLALWRGSPAGVLALAMLCGGDGLAGGGLFMLLRKAVLRCAIGITSSTAGLTFCCCGWEIRLVPLLPIHISCLLYVSLFCRGGGAVSRQPHATPATQPIQDLGRQLSLLGRWGSHSAAAAAALPRLRHV